MMIRLIMLLLALPIACVQLALFLLDLRIKQQITGKWFP